MKLDTVGLYDLGEGFHNQIVERTRWECRLIHKRNAEDIEHHLTDLIIQLEQNSKCIYYPVDNAAYWFEPGIHREVYFADIESCLKRRVEVKKILCEKSQILLRRNTLLDETGAWCNSRFWEYKVPLDCAGFIATTIVSEFGYGWSCSIVRIQDTPWFREGEIVPIYSVAGTSLPALAHTKEYFIDYAERLLEDYNMFS